MWNNFMKNKCFCCMMIQSSKYFKIFYSSFKTWNYTPISHQKIHNFCSTENILKKKHKFRFKNHTHKMQWHPQRKARYSGTKHIPLKIPLYISRANTGHFGGRYTLLGVLGHVYAKIKVWILLQNNPN